MTTRNPETQPEAGAKSAPSGSGLRIEGLAKAYGTFVAVRDLWLDVAPGEFVSLLGPSGSGKTTTLMAVAGFAAEDSGRIFIGDREITGLPPHRRDLGVVFQNYALFPHMTVGANIAFPLEVRKVARPEINRRVAEMLELVRLPGFEQRQIRQLSGGQQQRVALARALVHHPPVLLMDEPLGALDRKLREQMQLEIKRIHRAVRTTILYVTHDREEAMTMSDRVAVMRDGAIEQIGLPSVVYERPTSRFVADFLGDANLLRARVVDRDGGGCRVEFAGGASLARLEVEAAVGDSLSFAIRPERMRISAPDSNAMLLGVVEEVVYRGQASRYVVRVPDVERPVQVERANDTDNAEIKIGERIGLAWQAHDLSPLADPSPAP